MIGGLAYPLLCMRYGSLRASVMAGAFGNADWTSPVPNQIGAPRDCQRGPRIPPYGGRAPVGHAHAIAERCLALRTSGEQPGRLRACGVVGAVPAVATAIGSGDRRARGFVQLPPAPQVRQGEHMVVPCDRRSAASDAGVN